MTAVIRHWPWFALIASAAMLGAAHAFETFGHLAPCTLCYRQRDAYWIAGSIAAAGAAVSLTPWRERARRVIAAVLALAFLYSLYQAAFHAGVEQKWWPGPLTCSGGGARIDRAALDALLNGARARPPSCDTIAWSFLGLSMAAWNAVVSLGLVALSLVAALRKTP